MKNIKLLFALFAAIAFTAPTFAQHKGYRGERGHGGMKHLIETLNLSDTQKAQAKELRETYRTKMEALDEKDSDRYTKREQMHQLREEQEAAFKKILTAEQVAALDTKKAEKKAKREAYRNKMKSVDKSAMKDEMKAYKDENIKPVLLEQRKKLEPRISATDQAEIAELRVAMKAAKAEIKAVKGKYKGTRGEGKRGGDEGRKAVHSIKDKYAEKYEAAKALADKYDTQITTLLGEVKDEKGQWEGDMKGIKDKYFGDIKEELGRDRHKGKNGEKAERKEKRDHEGKGQKGSRHEGKRGHHRGKNDKVAFLLMDVNKAEKKAERKSRRAQGIKVFPNPSATNNTLQYTVNQSGNVKIELHDRSGNIIRTITNAYKTAGDYTETVDLNGLKNIVYFYVITDAEGTRSKKFMVKK